MACRRLRRGSHPSLVHQWASREVPPPPALCGPARVQKHDLIQEANSPGNWQADTQPLARSVAQKATQGRPRPLNLHIHRPKHDGSLQFIHWSWRSLNRPLNLRKSEEIKPNSDSDASTDAFIVSSTLGHAGLGWCFLDVALDQFS